MRRPVLLSALLLASTGACHKEAPPAPQAPVAQEGQADASGAPAGADKAVDVANKGKPAPSIEIKDAGGQSVRLSDLKGKPLLVNLWATWCVPCVKELPTIDKLAAQGGALQVVAVSEDMEGAKVVTPFLAKKGITTLKPHLDPTNALLLQLKEPALPVTILYDAQGKEVWRLRGDLDWTSARARALIAQAG